MTSLFMLKTDLRMSTITKLTPLFTKCNIQYGNFGFKKKLRMGPCARSASVYENEHLVKKKKKKQKKDTQKIILLV